MTKDKLKKESTVMGIQERLALIAKLAELLEGMDPGEAVRVFFSTLMLMGMEPSKIADEVKNMKASKLN